MNKRCTTICMHRPARGMTLVELLISMTIITVLMGIFGWMLVAGKVE